MERRDLLKSALALAAWGVPALPLLAAPEQLRTLGKAQAFDFAALKGMARALSTRPYRQTPSKLPKSIAKLSWDHFQDIHSAATTRCGTTTSCNSASISSTSAAASTRRCGMHELDHDQATEIAYDPALFDYGKSGVDGARLPPDLGFAGFTLTFDGDWQRDVAAFLGASYFRAVGGTKQYGLSARGLAIDSGLNTPEEFPIFTAFWFDKPAASSKTVTVYALLDSPSVAGAYRFDITPGDELTMTLDVALYPRKRIKRLGWARSPACTGAARTRNWPATTGAPRFTTRRPVDVDWRRRVDLAALNDPPHLTVNSFSDDNPRGFGLMQRDRNFDHYQDDGVWYDRRPSLWVEPKANGARVRCS